MNKEPIGLYILRLGLSGALLILVAMLYWSSLVTEEKINAVYAEVLEVKKKLSSPLKMQQESSLDYPRNNLSGSSSAAAEKASKQANDSFPNLFVEDPFYAKILPKMLGESFKPHGFFQEATVGRSTNLHPFNNWAQVASWHSQCNVSVGQLAFGTYDVWSPSMGIKMEARPRSDYNSPDAVEYWVHLRDDVFWQPIKSEFFSENIQLAPFFKQKHPVTAYDFAFYFNVLMNPHVEEAGAIAQRTLMDDIESIIIVDPQTFIVRWKVHEVTEASGKKSFKIKYAAKALTASLSPLPSHVFQRFADGSWILEGDVPLENYRTSPVWAQNFADHWAKGTIVSCGPWIFDGMNDREIKFLRNPDYFQPLQVLVEGSIIQFKEAAENVWQSFKADKIDNYSLQPNQLVELSNFLKSDEYHAEEKQGAGVSRLDYVMRAFLYIAWNQARPYFSSQKVRQALTMAIDRKRIIAQNLNGLGIPINGPFFRYSSSYDESIEPWPYDPITARRLLEEEGWYDSTGSGIIDKVIDGKKVPFRFTMTYFVKNSVTKSVCEYVATSLKELGIDCNLNGVDLADLSAAFDDKNFDAMVMGWSLGIPPEDPRQLWHSAGAYEKGSSNAIGFVNPEADKIIEALQFESDPIERQKLYFRFDAIIHETAPYTFLYSPKIVFLYRNYLQNVFIPKDMQQLIPGATAAEPNSSAFWLKKSTTR